MTSAEMTYADGRMAPYREGAVRRESYAPATGGTHVSKVMFVGPKMQLTTSIHAAEREYVLRGLFVLELEHMEDGAMHVSHSSVPVSGFGEDAESAMRDFCETFDTQWRALVEADEATLTPGGIRRKNAMTEVVERVVPAESD